MILRSNSFLGVSLGDRSIACAEVAVNGPRKVVRRMITFPLTAEMSLDKPAALGQALAAFLRHHKFSASRAVVGIPAKWLIALEKEIPPAGEEQARAMLLLQAERLAVSDSGEMVFDYSGKSDPKVANKVLLVGCLRQRLDQIEAIFDAAGISVQAITSSALTLARGVSNTDDDVPMLVLARQGAEMVWRHEGTPKLLRHVSVIAMNGRGPVTVAPLGSELNRTLALTRANGSPVATELLLWDGIGLSAQQLAELSERSGVRLRPSDPISMLGIDALTSPPEEGTPETFAPALSLAVAATDRQLLPVDFKRSRLTPRKTRKVSRNTVYATLGALAVLLGTIGLYVNVQLKQREFDRLQGQLTAEEAQIKTARTLVDRVRYAQGYFDSRPPVLECLREITLSLREEDRLWATSLTLRDDERRADNKAGIGRKGTLQGKASDNATVLTVLDRIRKNPKFTDVKLSDVRPADTKTRDVTFTATFNYISPE